MFHVLLPAEPMFGFVISIVPISDNKALLNYSVVLRYFCFAKVHSHEPHISFQTLAFSIGEKQD